MRIFSRYFTTITFLPFSLLSPILPCFLFFYLKSPPSHPSGGGVTARIYIPVISHTDPRIRIQIKMNRIHNPHFFCSTWWWNARALNQISTRPTPTSWRSSIRTSSTSTPSGRRTKTSGSNLSFISIFNITLCSTDMMIIDHTKYVPSAHVHLSSVPNKYTGRCVMEVTQVPGGAYVHSALY